MAVAAAAIELGVAERGKKRMSGENEVQIRKTKRQLIW